MTARTTVREEKANRVQEQGTEDDSRAEREGLTEPVVRRGWGNVEGNAYHILVGKCSARKLLGIHWCREKDNIKVTLE